MGSLDGFAAFEKRLLFSKAAIYTGPADAPNAIGTNKLQGCRSHLVVRPGR